MGRVPMKSSDWPASSPWPARLDLIPCNPPDAEQICVINISFVKNCAAKIDAFEVDFGSVPSPFHVAAHVVRILRLAR